MDFVFITVSKLVKAELIIRKKLVFIVRIDASNVVRVVLFYIKINRFDLTLGFSS